MDHYFKIWLKTSEEPFQFPVAEAAYGRFRRSFQAGKGGFFIFATRDGRTLALNLNYVRLARVWTESDVNGKIDKVIGQGVTLYFADRARERFEAGDPTELANIFSALKSSKGGEVLTFTGTDGNLVMFATEDLMLFEAPTDFVEEGFKQIYLQERGTLPPS